MITVVWSDHGTVQGDFCASLINSVKKDSKKRNLIDTVFSTSSGAAVAFGRNILFRDFLDNTESPWLLMLDADTIWKVEDIYNLYDIAVKNQVKVLTGTYFVNINCINGCFHIQPSMYRYEQHDGKRQSVFVDVVKNKDKEIIEIDWAGLGALLVHRSVLEDTKEVGLDGQPYWCAEAVVDGSFSGEDHYFYSILRKKGYKIYGTLKVIVGHGKKQTLNLESYMKDHNDFS
jgi:hypothetical protein